MSEEEALAAARARIDDVRARIDRVDDNALDLIFREARSHNWWTDRDVSDDQPCWERHRQNRTRV